MRKQLLLLLLFVSGVTWGQTNLTGFGNRAGIAAQKPKQNNAFLIEEGDSVAVFVLNPLDKISVPGTNVIVDANGNRFIRRKVSGTVSGPAQNVIVPAVQTALNGKEAIISPGSPGTYWRHDKTWATMNAAAVGLGNVPNVNATNAANLGSGFIPAARFGSLTIPASALSQSSATTGQVLKWNGSAWVASADSEGSATSLSAYSLFGNNTGSSATGSSLSVSQTKTLLDITGVTAATFGAKSDSAHTHPISKITGLQTALNLKLAAADILIKSDTTHRHTAAHLTSGTIPSGRYGTGTIPVLSLNASGSTADTAFLRRDGTWAVISQGTGGSSGLADPGSNGILARTGSGATTPRTLSVSGAGLSVSNGTGVSGNPTFSLANDVGAVEALTGQGFPFRVADGVWTIGNVDFSSAYVQGTIQAAHVPAFSGAIANTAGSLTTTYSGVVPANKGGAGAITGLLKANGSGTVSAATAGTDYVVPSGNITGNSANVTGTVAIANGGTGATTAANARTNLGGTTVGSNLFTLTNPSAITFLRINADNTATALDAAAFRTAIGAGSSSATVSSVGVSMPSIFSVSNTPITTSGTITATLASQTANYVFAAPTGSAGTPTFRALVAADMPSSIDATKLANGTITSTELQYINSVTSNVQTQLDAKAPLASPTFTGTPAAPTATAGTNTTQISTTAFVKTAIDAILKDHVNVKDAAYGALGNNSNDDTAELQAAINAGKRIYIPAGTYLISADLSIPSDRIIYGDGTNTVIKPTVTGVTVFQCYNASARSNIEIRNLKIDGGGQTSNVKTGVRNARGININNAKNVYIHDISIVKCGIIHPTVDTTDAAYGGYGIIISARNGATENVTIRNVYIADIAGGGMIAGDGIYVEGYNSNTAISIKGVLIDGAIIERVGRNGISVAGDPPYSQAAHVTITNCFIKNTALSGIDLEDSDFTGVKSTHLDRCGNYTGYYNITTFYGTGYRLRAGIAYGNYSANNTFDNLRINKCYFGITHGAGAYNTFNEIVVDSSDVNDMLNGTARFGENLTVKNSQFLSTGLTGMDWYNGTAQATLLVENCVFKSPTRIGGLKFGTFRRCNFNKKVTWTSTDNADVNFIDCVFDATDYGIHFTTNSTFCKRINIIGCQFIGQQYGVYATYQSVVDLNIINCTFKGITINAIHHSNANNETAFGKINNNFFDGVTGHGIYINQAFKYGEVIGNRFRGVGDFCIFNDFIITGTSTTDCTFADNVAVASCVNGFKIAVSTGSFDYVNIIRNNMRICSGTKSSISAGNSNGFNSQNFF